MLVSWFDNSFLELNAQKTQEMCFGRGRVKGVSHPVETVFTFKYLGTVVDENLTFTDTVDNICKKAQQRLLLLRKLRNFNISTQVLQLVYRYLIESVLSFIQVSWYGNLSVKSKAKLARVVNQAGKIVGIKQLQLGILMSNCVCTCVCVC